MVLDLSEGLHKVDVGFGALHMTVPYYNIPIDKQDSIIIKISPLSPQSPFVKEILELELNINPGPSCIWNQKDARG